MNKAWMEKFLESIKPHLEFMEQVPEEAREELTDSIMYEIFTYIADQAAWDETKEKDIPKMVKNLKRQLAALKKKRLERAVAFMAEITMEPLPIDSDETISDSAKAEIAQYITRLQNNIEENVIGDKLKDVVPSQPNKNKIIDIIKTIYKEYGIKGVDDNLRNLLPLIYPPNIFTNFCENVLLIQIPPFYTIRY